MGTHNVVFSCKQFNALLSQSTATPIDCCRPNQHIPGAGFNSIKENGNTQLVFNEFEIESLRI